MKSQPFTLFKKILAFYLVLKVIIVNIILVQIIFSATAFLCHLKEKVGCDVW